MKNCLTNFDSADFFNTGLNLHHLMCTPLLIKKNERFFVRLFIHASNSGDTLTRHGVVIYTMDGFVKWNGGANIQLDSPMDPIKAYFCTFLPVIRMFWSSIGMEIRIFPVRSGHPAQRSPLKVVAAMLVSSADFLGWQVNLSGSSNTNIDFQANLNFQPPTTPNIQLAQ